ncbi:hypothetical protein, partial [Actinomadura sp. GC306]|uniref:hypothetical protein n=1 Tax=Actinomadura sp. GC306 TaxID=2530367 RepID=UPI001A9DD8A2
ALYSAPRPEPRGEPRALPQRAPLPVDAAAAAFPRFDGTVVVVLDAPAPQAAALARVLAQVCARLEVIETGPVPPGAAGPAAGVRDAVAAGPDLVAVVSGGDGGALFGDAPFGDAPFGGLARAAVPVVLCHAPPAGGDPASAPPRRGFRQPDDLAGLLPWMLGHCTAGAPWVRAALHARLDDLDRRAGGLTARRAA